MLSKVKGYSEARQILGEFDLADRDMETQAHWRLIGANWQKPSPKFGVGTLELIFCSVNRQPNYQIKMRFGGVRDFLLDNQRSSASNDFTILCIRDRGWEDVYWDVGDGCSIEFLSKSAEIISVEEATYPLETS